MALGKRLIQTGVATCLTETTDIFGGSTGKALYSMDYDASDTSGVYNGTPSNVDFGVGGQINTGARFNGSSSKIEVSNQVIPNGAASISFWYNANGNTGTQYILGGGVATASKGITVYLSEISTGNHSFGALVAKGVSSLAGSATGTTVYSTTSWHHVVCTWDGTTSSNALKVYVNNSLLAQGTIDTTSASIGTYTNFAIGGLNGGTFADGTVDQVRIFSKVLTGVGGEVSTLYQEQACVHTATTTDVDYPVTNAAYYKLDNSGEDSKGTNDLTENNIEYRFGKYNQAGLFNGTNGYLYASNSVQQPTTNFSVSVWVLFHQIKTASTGVIGNFKTGVTPQIGWAIAHQNGTPLQFWADGTAGSSNDGMVQSTSSIPTNEWIHVVGTYDGSNVKIYINGTLENTKSYTQTPATTDQPLVIGRWYGNFDDLYTDGQIDQVRIFSTAISQANVTSLYNEKPETDTSNFKTVLYEGTSANQYISNVGMDLETGGGLVWIKNREQPDHHVLFDSVRGATKYIMSSSTGQETPDSATLTSFEKNGFFLGADGATGGAANGNNESLVAWCWKGGGAAVTNTNGANITSSVSANTAAGFSIVTYTGTGNGNVTSDTVGHGLSSTPDIVIVKRRNGNDNWQIQANIGGTYKSGGFGTGAFAVASPTPVADPTSTVFNPFFSNTTGTYVAYLWHSVSGYSRISTYTGAGSGTRVYTTDDGTSSGSNGFKPSFVVIKNVDTGGSGFGWYVYDTRRDDLDGDDNLEAYILWESNAAEVVSNTGSNGVVMENDGFTLDVSATALNGAGDTFLFMAFK